MCSTRAATLRNMTRATDQHFRPVLDGLFVYGQVYGLGDCVGSRSKKARIVMPRLK